jgi:TonB family protein
VRRLLLVFALAGLVRCAAPAPAPEPVPEPAPAPVAEEKVIGTVKVTASALNVRKEASTDAEVVVQVKKGQQLAVLEEGESWMRVKLENGDIGWVASRFVSRGGEKAAAKGKGRGKSKAKSGCPADSDFAFLETPTLAFSDSGAHGTVVVDATVNTAGKVTSTKVLSNSTGDESLAFLAEREIKSATFAPPIRNCVPRAFIFTYRRSY